MPTEAETQLIGPAAVASSSSRIRSMHCFAPDGVGVGHEEHELVALGAGDEVVRAGQLGDDAAGGAQDRVADGEAVRDVEPAEAVDVEHGDRQRMAVPAGAVDLGDEALVEAAQVGEARQGVPARAHAELALELAETPVGVAQLLLEQPSLAGRRCRTRLIDRQNGPVYCTFSARGWTLLGLVLPPAGLHLGVRLRVVHLGRAEGDDLDAVGARLGAAPHARRVPGSRPTA